MGNWMCDIPKASNLWNAVVRLVLDGWQYSGIVSFVSGSARGVGLSLADGADLTGGERQGVPRTGINNFDMTFFRNIRVREKGTFQFPLGRCTMRSTTRSSTV